MSRYIVSDVDLEHDRRYYWVWDTETGPVGKGLTRSDFIARYPEATPKRVQAAEKFGCSSPAYLFDELLALTGMTYEEFWKIWV